MKTSCNGKTAAALVIGAAILMASFTLDSIAGKAPQAPLATFIFKIFNFIGNGSFLFALCGALWLIGTAVKKDRIKLAFRDAFFSATIAGIFVQILKTAIERPRPSLAGAQSLTLKLLENPSLIDLAGKLNSMPSGHTTVSFAVAYTLGRHSPRFRPLLYVISALVGVARVYLGSHYPSDIIAGALLGLFAGWLITNPLKNKKRWLFAVLVILTVSMSFFKSGGFFLFDVDEAVFSEATREMVETGDFITPTYNYEPRYDKPILFYWLMSASYRLGGVSEASARAVSGVFGALLVIMTFFFLKRLKNDKTAFLGAVALLLNVEYFVYSHSAVTDMTLAFFITASLFSFYIGLESDEKKWPMAFWAASALATLTKGAIGLLFPLAISFLYLLASGRVKDVKKFLKPLHVALYLIIAAPWFAAETYVNGWDFINAFVIKHHFKRYTEVISSHGGPPYYYLGVLVAGFFPWVAFLPQALYKSISEYKRKTGGLYLFSAIWFAFVFVFFSISSTKLPNYIFPLMPASAILAGLFLYDLIETERTKERMKGLYAVLALSAVFSIALFILPSIPIKSEVALPPSVFYACGAAFLAVFLCFAASIKKPATALAGVSAAMITLIVVLRVYAIPPVSLHMQKDLYLLASSAKTLANAENSAVVIASYEINRPSLAFYAGRKVVKIEKSNACDIKEFAKRGRLMVITPVSRLPELKEYGYLKPVEARGKYMLLGADRQTRIGSGK